MVKFFTLLFFVTKLIWSSHPSSYAAEDVLVTPVQIFQALRNGDQKAPDYIDKYRKSLIQSTADPASFKKRENTFKELFESYHTPKELTFKERLKSAAFRTSVGFTVIAGIAELARLGYCTDCNWVPPVAAAIAGGNTALAFTQLTDNTYVLVTTLVVAFSVAVVQQMNARSDLINWKSVPGFLSPIVGGLTSFLIRKYLPCNARKENALSNYFTKLTSGDETARNSLFLYLSAEASDKGWSEEDFVLSCNAVTHLWTLEKMMQNRASRQ